MNYSRIENACRYARIYLATDRQELAVQALLKEAFNWESPEHLKVLRPLLVSYDKKKLKTELSEAIYKIQTDTSAYHLKHFHYQDYIVLNNVRLAFWCGNCNDSHLNDEARKKEMAAYLKKSEFYKLVMAL